MIVLLNYCTNVKNCESLKDRLYIYIYIDLQILYSYYHNSSLWGFSLFSKPVVPKQSYCTIP